jgi:hypothetical protein
MLSLQALGFGNGGPLPDFEGLPDGPSAAPGADIEDAGPDIVAADPDIEDADTEGADAWRGSDG